MFTNCSKYIPGRPAEYNLFQKKQFTENKKYPLNNLQSLNNSNVNPSFVKRALSENTQTEYNIVKQYITDYNNILTSNESYLLSKSPDEKKSIFSILKKQQDYKKITNYKKYPVKNVIATRYLKKYYNKMAIPPYMAEYIEPYYKNLDVKNDIKTTQFAEYINDITKYEGNNRDKIVQSILAWRDIYNTDNNQIYQEDGFSFLALEE